MTGLAVLAFSAQVAVFAGPQAKSAVEPSGARKAIPVAPDARRKMVAVFVKHAEAPLARHEEARTKVLQALLADNLAAAQRFELEMRERGAELDAAKKAIFVELNQAGYGKAVQEQEWKSWLAKREAARAAKTPSP
jgi:hypothetical protein